VAGGESAMLRPSRVRFALVPLALAAPLAAQVGTAHSRIVVGNGPEGLDGQLEEEDYFASSLAFLGDVDGDGVPDLAAGAPDEPWPPTDEDSVWILFLRPDGTVRDSQRLAQGIGGFSDPEALTFGWSVAGMGDVDGDGVPDLAAGVTANDGGRRWGRLWILFLRRDGAVRAAQAISATSGGFTGRLGRDAGFGGAAISLGDLDGDGVAELAVGAPGRGPGAIWILHLNRDGTVRSQQEIDEQVPALAGLLEDGDRFGGLLAAGDLDGDGDVDLATGGPKGMIDGKVWVLRLAADQTVEEARLIPRDEALPPWFAAYYPSSLAVAGDVDGDGSDELAIGAYDFRNRGAVAMVSLQPDLALRRSAVMALRTGGIGPLPAVYFGFALAGGLDLDGDGHLDLAVGAPGAHDEQGELWMLELADSGVRTGGSRTPAALTSAGEPVLGGTWELKLDCADFPPGLALVAAAGAPLDGLSTPFGVLLIDPASPRYFTLAVSRPGAGERLSLPVPNNLALLNLVLYVQGACLAPGQVRLSNALDVVVGR